MHEDTKNSHVKKIQAHSHTLCRLYSNNAYAKQFTVNFTLRVLNKHPTVIGTVVVYQAE